MKVVVLGAGLMGKEVARDLIKNNKVERVILGDIDVGVAQDFAARSGFSPLPPV